MIGSIINYFWSNNSSQSVEIQEKSAKKIQKCWGCFQEHKKRVNAAKAIQYWWKIQKWWK